MSIIERIESLTDEERDLISKVAKEVPEIIFVDREHIESWFYERLNHDDQLAYLVGISLQRTDLYEILGIAF